MLKKLRKGTKKIMEKVRTFMDILSSDKSRLIVGCVLVGTGLGFISSVYLKVPA